MSAPSSCKGCVSTATPPLCLWPCCCYASQAIGGSKARSDRAHSGARCRTASRVVAACSRAVCRDTVGPAHRRAGAFAPTRCRFARRSASAAAGVRTGGAGSPGRIRAQEPRAVGRDLGLFRGGLRAAFPAARRRLGLSAAGGQVRPGHDCRVAEEILLPSASCMIERASEAEGALKVSADCEDSVSYTSRSLMSRCAPLRTRLQCFRRSAANGTQRARPSRRAWSDRGERPGARKSAPGGRAASDRHIWRRARARPLLPSAGRLRSAAPGPAIGRRCPRMRGRRIWVGARPAPVTAPARHRASR